MGKHSRFSENRNPMHPTGQFCYNTIQNNVVPRLENNPFLAAMREKALLIPMLLVLLGCCWLSEAAALSAPPRIAPPPREPPPGVTRPGPPYPDEQAGIDLARLEYRIHDLINLERRRAGLPELAWNRALSQIARTHSRDMARRRFFSHIDPEGRHFTDRYRRAGFNCASRISGNTFSRGGENIAYNARYSTIARRNGRTTASSAAEEQLASDVVRQWMTSSSHRRNILTRYFRREGIGAAIGEDGKVLVTQNFC